MDFAFSEEQDMLRASARDWLARQYPASRVAALADGELGWDPTTWPELVGLGWLDDDLSVLDLAVLAEETGQALLPGPWWSSVALAGPVLGRPPARPTTLAWAENGAPGLADPPATTARPAGSGWVLSGRKVRVPDLAAASEVLVTAVTDGGVGIWRVAAGDLTVRPMSTPDGTRRLGAAELDDCPAELVVEPGAADEPLAAVRRRALALLCCEAVGILQRALDLAAEHVTQRVQFGRPIGSYQAVSHPLAEVYSTLTMGRALAYRAAWAVQTGVADVEPALALAQLAAGDGAVQGCEVAIQAMGGIGFTWDHPLHRYYKRAQAIACFEGTARTRRAVLATSILG